MVEILEELHILDKRENIQK